MGHGIALVSAKAGFDVVMRDIEKEFVETGLKRITGFLEKSVEKGKLDSEEKDKILSRIKGATSLEDLKDADVVIEAIFENAQVKKVFVPCVFWLILL